MEEHLLLVLGEVNIGEHDGTGAGLDPGFGNEIGLTAALLPRDGRPSQENVFVEVQTESAVQAGGLGSAGQGLHDLGEVVLAGAVHDRVVDVGDVFQGFFDLVLIEHAVSGLGVGLLEGGDE